jgi:diaminohydroxyphosphoribosylaminopyrimidine deaminase/5-amino-6-(5-phosphoribosylamino)uracil reductase
VTADASTTRASEIRVAGARVIQAADLRDGLRQLRASGIRSLLVEGGATIASAFLAGKLVHRLVIFQAPVTLGPSALHAFDGASPGILRALELYPVLDRKRLGPDVMTIYALAEG